MIMNGNKIINLLLLKIHQLTLICSSSASDNGHTRKHKHFQSFSSKVTAGVKVMERKGGRQAEREREEAEMKVSSVMKMRVCVCVSIMTDDFIVGLNGEHCGRPFQNNKKSNS